MRGQQGNIGLAYSLVIIKIMMIGSQAAFNPNTERHLVNSRCLSSFVRIGDILLEQALGHLLETTAPGEELVSCVL